MRRRVTLIFALATVLAVPLPLALAEPTNQVQYLNIYLKIYEAENLEKQGDYRGALDDFKECYGRLDKLHTTDPNWETALVVQRMRDCKERIAELQTKVDSMPPAGPANPAPDVPAVATDNGSDAGDLTAMKKQLAEVQEELKVTKGALEDMTAKYQNSQIESQTLRSQLVAVNQQLAALNTQQSVDKTTGKLMEDNKALTDKLEQAQAQIKTLSGNPKSNLAKLNVQLKNLQDKLDASEANNTALQQTTTTLQQQLSQAQTDLSAANQKLAETSTGAPEYATIKHENEVMRGILQREIQEQSRRDGAKRLIQEEFDRLKITSRVLQEQFDILGSPMTPPTSDEERALMASLKVPAMQVAPPDTTSGNVLVAPASPSADTNTAAPTSPATVTTTDTNTPPAVTGSDTNQPPVTVVTPPSTDTNAPSNVPETNTVATTVTPPAATDTNTPPATPETNTVATTVTPSSTDTNTPSAPADTNAPTTTTLPPATTTYTDTTVKNPDQSGDPNRYSSKPRIPDDMRDTAQQATDLFKMQRYDEAAAKYQTILDKYPDCLYAWSNLGVVRYQQGSLNDALKALQQAVKLAPNDAFSYRNLGIVYYQLNQNDAAIDALERSIALDPNNAWSHDYLGCACSQKGWEEVAEKEFRKAIEIDETFGEAHSNLAVIYASQKPPSLELARRHYNRALELGIAKDPRLEKLLKQ